MQLDNTVGAATNKAISLAELRWQCRRGMLELDLILLPFLEKSYPHLEPEEQQWFAALLTFPDPMLYNWLLEKNESDTLNITLQSAELEVPASCSVTVEGLQKIIQKIREGYNLLHR